MNKEKLKKVRDLLGFSNQSLGKELGFVHTNSQCKQVDNLISGSSGIKGVLVIALECLARRQRKLNEFNEILNS